MRDEEKTKERLIEELRALRDGSMHPEAHEKSLEVESRRLEANRQRALQELDHGMRSATDLQDLYRAFARHSLPILRYYRTSILLMENGRSIIVYASGDRGDSGNVTTGATIANEDSKWVIANDEPILRDMSKNDDVSVEDEQMLGSGMISCMIVPLHTRGRVIGAWLVSSRRAGAYDRDDVAMAQSLADSLATQIEILKLNETADREASARHRVESSLWMTARRFQSLIEASNDIVVILDAGGLFRYATPSTSRILGYPSEEMIGKHVVAFAHPVDAPSVAEALQVVSDYPEGGSATIDHRVRHRDGSWRNMTASFTNLLERPSVNGIVINYQDVTERKRIEGQLFQSQKMEAIGRLAGGVAHDFNNLLTVILGNCGLILSDRHHGKATRGLVEQIRRAGERAASLTGQLLTFSRKHATEVKALDLNSVVRNMDAMLRRMIGEHITLKVVASRDLGSIKVDLGQMEQIVLNLVVNAHDAMEKGGTLMIETRNVHRGKSQVGDFVGVDPGDYVMLMVSDEGEGMDEATRDRVFEPFFTTKEQGHGTGLGLSTVHGIVTQAGGHISLDSELGRGTMFKIYFPKSEEGIDAADPTPNEARSNPGSETILLVEDDEMVRDLAHHVLLREGYVVLKASRGSEAVEICERYSEPIHLLVTDVVMPGGLNGYQTAGRIVSQRPEMAVLYISGYVDEAIVNDQRASAQSTFLQKPFVAETLSRSVRDVLDGITGGRDPG